MLDNFKTVTSGPNTPVPGSGPTPTLPMLEAAGSCQSRCRCLNSRMFWCTRDVDSAALVQLTRKYDKRKQESSGQLIDQDDAKGEGRRPCLWPCRTSAATACWPKLFQDVVASLWHPSPPPFTALHLLFLAAFQECCNAACSYRVRHCVRRPLAKNESVAIISGLFVVVVASTFRLASKFIDADDAKLAGAFKAYKKHRAHNYALH